MIEIGSISTAIEVQDNMSSTLMVIDNNIDRVCDSLLDVGETYDNLPGVEMLNEIIGILQNIDRNTTNIAYSMQDVVEASNDATVSITRMEPVINDNVEAQREHNDTIRDSTISYDSMLRKIEKVGRAIVTAFAVDKIMGMSDRIISTNARIGMMNDGLRNTEELIGNINHPANDTRIDTMNNDLRTTEELMERINQPTANVRIDRMNSGLQTTEGLMTNINQTFNATTFGVMNSSLSTTEELMENIKQSANDVRIGMMNDGLQSTEEIIARIKQSANDARGNYLDMADAVAKLGNNARDAFSSTQEIIDFTNLIQKQFVLAGAGTTESKNAMLQLTQALGSGVLRGDELNSIFEQAPNLIQNIANYIGVSIGEIRELASNGEITADIVKNSMFAAADDINSKFAQMPVTFSQVITQIANTATTMFEPILYGLNDAINGQDFQNVVEGITNGLYVLSKVATAVFGVMADVSSFVLEYWSVIAPVVFAVAGAVTAYTGAITVHNVVQSISNGLKKIAAIRAVAHSTATAAEAAATVGMTTAQMSFNAALYACPLVWIIGIIVAAIAIIYAVVAAINKVTDSTISATGIIFGAVSWLCSLIVNTVIGMLNSLIQTVWTFASPFISIIEWILNACNGGFNSFGGAVANLIGQIISWFLDLGQIVTSIIDAIFGTDWTSGLQSLQDTVLAWGKTDDAITISREAPQIEYRMDMTDSFDKGYDFGKGIDRKVSNMFTIPDINTDGLYEMPDYASILGDIALNTGKTADNTAKGVDISDEHFVYLRDLAEKETINKYTTAEIKVEMTNNNNIASKNDIDGIISEFKDKLEVALNESAKGVHE